MSATTFRALLEAGDVDGLRAFWAEVSPHLPQPESRDKAEIIMHMTRTSSDSVAFKYRAWSHRWLTERDIPSQLPDALKPKAEQLCLTVVDGVGISVSFRNPLLKPVADEVRRSMEGAVEEAYADGHKEPAFVRSRMTEARDRTYQSLLGIRS